MKRHWRLAVVIPNSIRIGIVSGVASSFLVLGGGLLFAANTAAPQPSKGSDASPPTMGSGAGFALMAAGKLASPHEVVSPGTAMGRGWLVTRDGSGGISAQSTGGGAAGSPTSLAIMGGWITSNYMPDASVTSHIWYDIENLYLFSGIITDSTASVTMNFTVVDGLGHSVATGGFSASPLSPGVNETPFDLGVFPVGDYKITVTAKQGKRTASDRFWIRVFQTPM